MIDVVVHPATAERWPDVQRAVGHGDGSSCWCQWMWLRGKDFGALKTAERRERLHEMTARDPAPGLVAYVGDEPAGWCGLGPRVQMERLQQSRTIPKADDRNVWSVVCFLVRKEFRGHKVTDALLDSAIAYAAQHGVACLEAYPVDASERPVAANAGYVGVLSVFERHGFRRVMDTSATADGLPRVLVRLELAAGPGDTPG